MITMEVWEAIRLRCERNGEPKKTVARDLGISPNTLRNYLRRGSGGAPKRGGNKRACKLDAYRVHIDELLRSTPKITAVRIGSCLRRDVDASLQIEESTLRKYVARRRAVLVPKEAFVRAEHAPGDQAQFDFSPMSVMLAGMLVVVEVFVMRLSYSGRTYARASHRCDRPSLFAGLLGACQAFGGTPKRSIFDNASSAVKRVMRGTLRLENDEFTAFRGGLLLEVAYAAPRKGNEKGGVEGAHGFIEDNFFRPVPSFASMEDLNAALLRFCDDDQARTVAGQSESVGARFEHERSFLHALPAVLPRTCVTSTVHINKFAEIAFETNWYSVPTRFAHRNAVIEVYENQLRIVVDEAVIAEHRRGFGRGERFLDVRHALELLKHKHRAAETAAMLSDSRIPAELRALFERYRVADPRTATKRWTTVLGLLESVSPDELAQTVVHAAACGTEDPEAIALLVMQRHAKPPSVLDRERLPLVAQLAAPPPDLTRYSLDHLVESAA